MTVYNCLLVDDEPLAIELLEEYIQRLPNFKIAGTCANAFEASDWLSKNKADLLFLDINMPVLNGTDFFKSLLHKPHVIFTTAYREYALEGFELNAIDYLLKPIIFDRFFTAIQKFLKEVARNNPTKNPTQQKQQSATSIFLNQGHKKIKVSLQDVLYIESFKDYVVFHTKTETIRTKENIGNLQKKLGENFLRIHRSYLVSKNAITAFTKQDIEINKIEIPIGSSYKKGVFQFLETLEH